MKISAVPPPSQPRWGSTAPTLELRHGLSCVRRHNSNPTINIDPLWELSSFSEAAIAECQAVKISAVPPPSQPRRGSTAPTVELRHGLSCVRRHNSNPAINIDPQWELSSFSEAAIAECQEMKISAVPPPSQPRWGSTAPTVELRHGSNCVRRHNSNPAINTGSLWELSSFSEAAIAECQAMKISAVPPPSQPRRGSTAPTVELRHGSNCVRRRSRSS
ncbi:hypothetical protein PS683_03224 [Pseudomonas fluorescens]|uniref:Uncharacterized protein n=1 Tax=Pseudomonas fluorescens TaxID=294 RepID=A0A5E6U1X0_PSEFL|nr:hypothetical protein PS683_03224 [Pseudomonas fluorescens]VVM98832.1 hypothetical protein PS683_03224 [Pseudomonas fluorescens]